MNNLWLYTEERPRADVIQQIINIFCTDYGFNMKPGKEIKIVPLIKEGKFQFTYQVTGISSAGFEKIYIKTVSGYSSFVDYMLFYQADQPDKFSTPLYLIEETKTDDQESRNTGVYQRCSKFVYADFFYPNVKKIMLYSLKIEQKETPTASYIFGTRMLLTLGVEIVGKKLDEKIFVPFKTIDEMIELKNSMRKPPKGNVPVNIERHSEKITISGKLEKAGKLNHDPNIGMLTIIAACLRNLGWKKDIVITMHGLPDQKSVGKTNKFILIANKVGIKLDGLELPHAKEKEEYWKEETNQEKIGTIFTAIMCEEYSDSIAIYENHGGCERGYFLVESSAQIDYLVIPKYSDRKKYKDGDKTYIVYIPDVVIYDRKRNLIINGEGKTAKNQDQGIKELDNFDFFEEKFIEKYYHNPEIQRTLILYGGEERKLTHSSIGLLLNENGEVIIGKDAPLLFSEAYEKLLSSQ